MIICTTVEKRCLLFISRYLSKTKDDNIYKVDTSNLKRKKSTKDAKFKEPRSQPANIV